MATESDDTGSRDDEIVEGYIEKLLAMDRRRDRGLAPGDLRQVARELGLGDAELARAEEAAEEHATRGRNFYEHGTFGDAIAEFRQALVLRPLDANLICELAWAHWRCFDDSGERDDRDTARELARRAVDLDPDCQSGYQLIRIMEKSARDGRIPRIWIYAGVLVAGAAIIALVLWSRSSTETKASATAVEASPPPPPSSGTAAPLSTTVGKSRPTEAPAADRDEVDLPVKLVDDEERKGVVLEVEKSRLRRYSGQSSFGYDLQGTLAISVHELRKLRVRIELVSPDGKVVEQKYVDLRAAYMPALRPGDRAPVRVLVFEKHTIGPVSEARVVVDIIDQAVAAPRYEPDRDIELEWEIPRPEHIDVIVRERDSQVRRGTANYSHWVTLTVHNRGQRAVEHLRVKVSRFDSDGKEIASTLTYLASSAGPAIGPGQTWVIGGYADIGQVDSVARYRVSVVEAR